MEIEKNSLQKVKLESSEVAFVIKKFEDSPKVGLYIPTLMSDVEMSDKAYEKKVTVSNSMIKNKDKKFSFEPLTVCNYYEVEPYDPALYYAECELGDQVRIKFLDNDIKKCYYYDDTYKMTDALMDEVITIKETLEELGIEVKDVKYKLAQLERMINSDN